MKGIQLLVFIQLILFIVACSSNQVNKTNKKMSTERAEEHLYEESQSLDETLIVKADAIEQLKVFLKKEKFGPEERTEQLPLGYVGFLPEEARPVANGYLNKSVSRLIALLEKNDRVTQRMILNEFEIGLNSFNDLVTDTEDRERICWYYEDIMDMIGLESTHQLLNNWMY